MILTNKDQTLIILDQGAIPARWQKGAGDVFYPFGVKTVTITVPKEGGGGEEEEVDKLRGGSPSPAPNFGPPVKTELYQLQQHGFLRELMPYTFLLDKERCEGSYFFKDNSETYGVFPWAFLVQAKFRLHEYGFSHSILVKTIKTGRLEPMPWGIAFHPYFYTPKGEARIRIGDREFKTRVLSGGSYALKDLVDAAPEIVVELPGVGTVEMVLDGLFREDKAKVHIWTDSSDYVCVEPTVAHPNQFGKKGEGVFVDRDGEATVACTYTLYPD